MGTPQKEIVQPYDFKEIATPSFPKELDPSSKGGWGRERGLTTGGIGGKTYASQGPQDAVPSQVRIVAVVGATDYKDMASPLKDGWLFSDFYYIHHLFRKITSLENQRWFTCVSPEKLVEKYEQFVHGDPRSDDRRIVLNKSRLASVKNEIWTLPPQHLLGRFLATVRETTQQAAMLGQQVLIIIVAHGRDKDDYYSMWVGGNPTADHTSRKNELTIKQMQVACDTRATITVLTCACYSGGWVISPNLPNISMITPFGPNKPSVTWSTAILGRVNGSRFASGLTKALVRINLPGIEFDESSEGQDNWEEGILSTRGPSYAALYDTVYDEVLETTLLTKPMMSAQSDEWDMHWSRLAGLREQDIIARRSQLHAVPKTDPKWLVAYKTGSSDQVFLYSQCLTVARSRAESYLASHPGPDEWPTNIGTHNWCRSLLRGQEPGNEDLELWLGIVEYRLRSMITATKYKSLLGADYIDCEEFDYVDWLLREQSNTSIWPVMDAVWTEAYDKLTDAKVFDKPEMGEGDTWPKGRQYLAAVMASSFWSSQSIDESISTLKIWKESHDQNVDTVRVLDLSTRIKIREKLESISKKTKKRLRSLSPRKSTRRLKSSVDSLPEGSLRMPKHRPGHRSAFSLEVPEEGMGELSRGRTGHHNRTRSYPIEYD